MNVRKALMVDSNVAFFQNFIKYKYWQMHLRWKEKWRMVAIIMIKTLCVDEMIEYFST